MIADPKQEDAVDFASEAMKLLKEKVFLDAMKAVIREDLAAFKKACEDAGIPDNHPTLGTNFQAKLYAICKAGLAEWPGMMAWP